MRPVRLNVKSSLGVGAVRAVHEAVLYHQPVGGDDGNPLTIVVCQVDVADGGVRGLVDVNPVAPAQFDTQALDQRVADLGC